MASETETQELPNCRAPHDKRISCGHVLGIEVKVSILLSIIEPYVGGVLARPPGLGIPLPELPHTACHSSSRDGLTEVWLLELRP